MQKCALVMHNIKLSEITLRELADEFDFNNFEW
jgi:hypothetical protein